MFSFKSAVRSFIKFRQDRSGNIAIIAAICAVPIISLACGSVDVIRMTTFHLQLQSAADAAALAAASLSNKNDPNETVEDFLTSNLPTGTPWETLKYQVVLRENRLSAKDVTVIASVLVDTPFLSLVGLPKNTVKVKSVATQSAKNLEISMVLDISESMDEKGKIQKLRSAAKEFVNVIVDNHGKEYTSFNLVPFAGSVNLGSTIYNRYANKNGGNTIRGPSKSQYNKKLKVPYRNFLFGNGQACIEYRDADIDLEDIPSNSRAQVPHFYRWSRSNSWCPHRSAAAIFNSNDITGIRNRIDGMQVGDGTGMDVGTLWGAKALSPSLKGRLGGNFSDRPAPFNDSATIKIAIIMTDGEITPQWRPQKPRTGRKTDIRSGVGEGGQIVVSSGDRWTRSGARDNAVAYFKRMCEKLKANNVQVYTIGFQVDWRGDANHLLSNCASNPSNYFRIENLNLERAFDAIAQSLSTLRVSG
ncbi:MAG: hypothetical protein K5905_28065 [Roseibium sp.]|uniref:pilus assembly protein TadG-related protein n=1 Tax=Roseibium sp. TaxID=1936156 RepID=UPI00261099C3|nr:pilus assembly protein TadG-related protein [Roseibium sp.]MCV0429321.1 hypothetical protein [Roseibium sp.]